MKMKISILYNMIVNSQLNRNNLTRCYTKSFQDVSKTFINVNDEPEVIVILANMPAIYRQVIKVSVLKIPIDLNVFVWNNLFCSLYVFEIMDTDVSSCF